MKNIPPTIYESLTHEERTRAMIAAAARNDIEEIKTLWRTCPRISYTAPDIEFSGRMKQLITLSLALEADMLTYTLNLIFALLVRASQSELQKIVTAGASTHEAWLELLDELGIDPEEMEKAAPPRHPLTTSMLNMADEGGDEEQRQVYLKQMQDALISR